jgi:predicted nucleotidyltransferase
MPNDPGRMTDRLTESLKKAAAALEDEGIPYLLGGGLACWARGGPPSSNDVDLMMGREDAERALTVLDGLGMRTERPPEQWLFKAWDGEVMIDLIFGPAGIEIDERLFERGDALNVDGMQVQVMALDDVFVAKLLAFDEHSVDYTSILLIARTLREQLDWSSLRERTFESPFAAAFFVLAERLGIVPGRPFDPSGKVGPR